MATPPPKGVDSSNRVIYMYKALDVRDNSEVVIINPKWLTAIDQLRELGKQDILICQGCKQPVWVRAGEQKQKHFAHKHLENCNYADESPILRNSRAVLYEWLVNQFGENVTIEKQVNETDLFRPIDCWVTQDSKVFAYWIFDSTLKLDKRIALQNSAKKLGIQIQWIFAFHMHRTEQDNPDHLVLSTTEREFIQRSKYDPLYVSGYSEAIGSLHYLDAVNKELITFRSLSLYHNPQVYKGFNLTSELEKVLTSPHNGEFVYSGEDEKLKEYEQKKEQEELKKQQALKEYKERLKPISKPSNKRWETPTSPTNLYSENIYSSGQKNLYSENIEPSSFFEKQPATCEFCGQTTNKWWFRNGKTGFCKCDLCRELGKF